MSDASHRPKQQTGFTRGALDYMETLLALEMRRHASLISQCCADEVQCAPQPQNTIKLAHKLNINAEDPMFEGGGWSVCEGTEPNARRWMKRLAGLLLFAKLDRGGSLMISGAASTRKRFAKNLHIEIAGRICETHVSISFSGHWRADCKIPPIQSPGPHMLTLSTIGVARRNLIGPDRASLAVTGFQFFAND